MFIAALFTIAKLWKQPRCPGTDKWIKKMWNFIQPQRRIKWMELENIILSKVSQAHM
jgi:hypothetical protein